MAAAVDFPDVKDVLSSEEIVFDHLQDLRRQIHCHVEFRTRVEEVVGDFAAVAKNLSSENKAEVRRGVARWLLGQAEQAIEILEPTRTSREREFFLGLSLIEARRYEEALAPLKEAYSADSSDLQVSMAFCEAKILAGRVEDAEAHVERLKKKDGGTEGHYLAGLLFDVRGFHDKAMAEYEKALDLDPGYAKALFRLAYIMDLSGEDSRALELYEQLRKLKPMHANAVMNLGVLYEDRGDYERAVECYQAVLDYFPTNSRAKLYLKDAQASLTMFYDEEALRREAKLQQVLNQPVGEISFSPRVRTALEKLGIASLGELVQRSEEELMTIPNFGRTSLKEVKEFLSAKGLAMAAGGSPGGVVEEGVYEAGGSAEGGDDAILQQQLAEMEWAGRIRKVFEKMGFVSLGDLVRTSEKELLKNKNLGLTSIKEIRKRLVQMGLSLKAD